MPFRLGRLGSVVRSTGIMSRFSGIGSRLSGSLSRIGGSLSGILKTSGGGIIGGVGAGYGWASIEQWLGQEDDSRRLMILGGAALIAVYALGQLFDIQIGGN